LRLGFLAPDGSTVPLDLVADTGCPYEVILAPDVFERLRLADAAGVTANFGDMTGGCVRLFTPGLGLVEFITAFGSNELARHVRNDHPDFAGLVGLPILRLAEYGGDADTFWISSPS
jgi:hypothetical protein